MMVCSALQTNYTEQPLSNVSTYEGEAEGHKWLFFGARFRKKKIAVKENIPPNMTNLTHHFLKKECLSWLFNKSISLLSPQ